MAGWNGSGQFTRVYSWVADAAAGIDITASRVDADTNNITSNGFSNCLTRDGQGSATSNLPLNGFRFTGASNGVAAQDFVTMAQLSSPASLNLFATGLTINSSSVIGATFIGTGSGTNLVATNVVGTIVPGSAASATIVGTGIPASTFIVSQTSGTPGGAGTYVTNHATTASVAQLSVQAGGIVVQTGGVSVTGGIVSNGGIATNTTFQCGIINNLSLGNAIMNVESTTGVAAQFMNSTNSANAVTAEFRNDRTDGFAIAFQFGNSTVGSISQNGTNTAYNTSSDQRLKLDDGLISGDDAIDMLRRLRPRWYRWKTRSDAASEPGFFAQQLHKVFPWAVTKGHGKPGSAKFRPWQMDASKLMPVVVAALQATVAENRKLERRLAALEARV